MHHAQDVPFIWFSILQNKQMVSKMLKNKIKLPMSCSEQKLYTTRIVHCLWIPCIYNMYTLTKIICIK